MTRKRRRKYKSSSVGGTGKVFYSACKYANVIARKIFPHKYTDTRTPIEGSALARIKDRRRIYNERNTGLEELDE